MKHHGYKLNLVHVHTSCIVHCSLVVLNIYTSCTFNKIAQNRPASFYEFIAWTSVKSTYIFAGTLECVDRSRNGTK